MTRRPSHLSSLIPDMLGKARGGSQIRYLEMFQQGFQLWKLLFTGRDVYKRQAHRLAVKDEPISVIHGESHQVPSPPSTPWRLHLLFHAMSGCVLALLHAFLQLLFVSVVDRIHQCSPGPVSYTHLDVYKRQSPD